MFKKNIQQAVAVILTRKGMGKKANGYIDWVVENGE